ncbi:NosD domain-containing protein [Halegenticoccus tardaugens]|uniref:NosD domain-containing protein n=1 Tax=Halegenticoccus tardaugens TaxID=2071624 RepID=UPI00100B62F2|nr:NosD domain-containing protein [Halegenticoccus tardaugens]
MSVPIDFGGAERIDGPTTISQPGEYVLATDLTGSPGTNLSESCIRIESSDVVLDGRGRMVGGGGISGTKGVTVASSSTLTNVTVKNLTVFRWNRGIYLKNVTDATIRNVTARENAHGIYLENAVDNAIVGNTLSNNLVGVGPAATANRLSNNTLDSNHVASIDDEPFPSDLF